MNFFSELVTGKSQRGETFQEDVCLFDDTNLVFLYVSCSRNESACDECFCLLYDEQVRQMVTDHTDTDRSSDI